MVSEEDVLEIWKAVYILQKASAVPRWDVNQLAGMVNINKQLIIILETIDVVNVGIMVIKFARQCRRKRLLEGVKNVTRV